VRSDHFPRRTWPRGASALLRIVQSRGKIHFGDEASGVVHV
jgi:hypothetical protein